MKFFNSAVKQIGKGLAQTAVAALSDKTGYDIGGTLNFLFGDEQTTGGQNMEQLSNELDSTFSGSAQQKLYIQDSITQQQAQLINIGQQLTAIASTVTQIALATARIEALLEQINLKLLYISWAQENSKAETYINSIYTSYDRYCSILRGYENIRTSSVEDLKRDILNTNNGAIVGLNGLNGLINGSGRRKGLLQLFSEMIEPLIKNGLMTYQDGVNQYFDYYQQLTYAQLTATNLGMEAYNLNGETLSAKELFEHYKSLLLNQEDAFLSHLVPLVYSGVIGSETSSQRKDFGLDGWNASQQINPNVSSLQSGIQFYSPSSVFYEAEALLSALYDTGSEDRRIVLHMIYPGSIVDTLPVIGTLQLALQEVNSPSNIIMPGKSSTLGSPYAFPNKWTVPDRNWVGQGTSARLYIRRYVFSAKELEDTQYSLQNMNGQGNLIPITSYATYSQGGVNTVNFQQEAVLDYTVGVNMASNFDFMNFQAYNLPIFYNIGSSYRRG